MCIERPIGVQRRQIYKHGYLKGQSDESLKIKFCDAKFGHQIIETLGVPDYKMTNVSQIRFRLANEWSRLYMF